MRWLAAIALTALLAFLAIQNRHYLSGKVNLTLEQLVGNKIKIESGKYVELENASELNPGEKEDFAFLIWFKLKSKLSNKEKVQIVEKYDAESDKKPGWALRISNNKKIYRPEIYWVNKSGKGRWYSFTDFPFNESHWFGMMITYTDGKFLGLKLLTPSETKKIESQNLGGYSLKGIFPESSVSLKAGSVGGKLFSGAIGRIYYGPGLLDKKWQQKIKEQCLDEKANHCLVK
jgi:hypothetical protein